jgi:hypothetical protein
MLPLYRPLRDKSFETGHRVVGGHELVEIKSLNGADLVFDARDVVEPRRFDCVA